MAWSTWYVFTEGMVRSDNDQGGVYQMRNRGGTIIYIGSSGKIKTRLMQHLSEDAKACIRTNAYEYQIDYRSDFAAEELRLYDAFVSSNGRQPQCNSVRPPG
jgi:hypothetical protein